MIESTIEILYPYTEELSSNVMVIKANKFKMLQCHSICMTIHDIKNTVLKEIFSQSFLTEK